MFKGIRTEGNGTYTVLDTDFAPTSTSASGPTAIIRVYRFHKRNPIHALQLYYERFAKIHRLTVLNKDNREWRFHSYVPNTYYKCIKRHLAKLDYIGK